MSQGGVPVIALPSTAAGGNLSRIVPMLQPGAGVVTTRADVHYVVTEFGIAQLYGKTLRQRVRELMEVAHLRVVVQGVRMALRIRIDFGRAKARSARCGLALAAGAHIRRTVRTRTIFVLHASSGSSFDQVESKPLATGRFDPRQ